MNMRIVLASLIAVLGALPSRTFAQADWDIVLNGRAVHLNAEREWNEENWGLGFEREITNSSPWVKVALANGFKDSVGEPSYMAGGGIKRRFRMFSDNLYLDVGVIGFLMTRKDVNRNQPFPGALPALTFGSRRVAINVTYLPDAVVDRVTNANLTDPDMAGVLFLQLKLDASLFGFRSRHR
jgi:Antimicrobial peptide resistance and lipid A acylation protein PagP